MTRHLAVGVFVLLCLARPTRAAEPPAKDEARLEITLKPVRWQPLPDQVEAVYVGPDQRIWYLLDQGPGQELAAIKRQIEREFRERSPQVAGARPCLFERGGRVWFATDFPTMLLGYDGQRWIEHDPNAGGPGATTAPAGGDPASTSLAPPTTRPTTRPIIRRPVRRADGSTAPRPRRIRGNVPGHGTWFRGSPNLQVGDTLFFLLTDGVTTYDTPAGRFVHTVMSAEDPDIGLPIVPEMVPSPDGAGAIVVVTGPDAEQSVWRWRGGAWAQSPPPWPPREPRPPRPVLMADGAWVSYSNKSFAFYTFDGTAPKALAPLLKQIGADDFQTRDRATAALKAMGPSARPWLEQARQAAGPETALRIDVVLGQLVSDGKVAIGPARMDFLDGVRAVGPRHVVVTGHNSGPTPYRSFLVGIGTLGGELDAASLRPFRTPWASDSGCIPGHKPDHVWMPRAADGRAALMDLQAARVVDTLPDEKFNWLHAATAAGTLYVGPAEPSQMAMARPIMVYQPAAGDDRAALKTTVVPIARCGFCVASDGAIWTEVAGTGIVRFDGDTWKPVAALAGMRDVTHLLPGINGEIVVVVGLAASMVDARGGVVRADTLEALIERNRPAIAAAFPAGKVGPTSYAVVQLFCDPGGNVWLRQGGPWRVLTKAGWQDGNAAANAAADDVFHSNFFRPLNDGKRVLLSGGNHPRGFTFLAGVNDDGKLLLDKAPHRYLNPFQPLIVGQDGAAYVPGKPILKFDAAGKGEELPVSGYPCLCDSDGNLWICARLDQPSNDLTLWRDGKVRQTVSVPSFGSGSQLLAGKAGSVLVRNNAGVHRLTARDGTYGPAKTYAGDGVPTWTRAQYSSLGFVVIQTMRDTPRQELLHLVEIPR